MWFRHIIAEQRVRSVVSHLEIDIIRNGISLWIAAVPTQVHFYVLALSTVSWCSKEASWVRSSLAS